MGAQPSLFDVHAPALDPRDVTQVFELLDKDGSGRLAGSEVTKMFAAMCGRPVKVHGAKSSYSLNEFIEAVEDMGRRQPFLNITGNLVKYVRENKEKMKPVDAFSDERIEAVSTFLDKDKSGAIEPDELLRFLQYLHIPLFTIFGVVNSSGVIKSNAQLQRLLRKLAKQCPQLEIEQKIIKISGDIHAGDASKPPQYQEATASAEPPEPAAGRRKKALLIGINYTGSRMPLRGCINDVKSQYTVLTTKFGYSSSEIRLMTDDTNDSSKVPNKRNMMAALKWLVEGVKPGDELFFHYSGHGSQCPDRSGREPDGKNECLCPTDCTKGFPEYVITDDQMQNFFSQIPEGAKMTCLFDCCHSATMGDLCVNRELGLEEDIVPRYMEPPPEAQEEIDSRAAKRPRAAPRSRGLGGGTKQVWTLSGCQDNQTSADAVIGGVPRGAFSWALMGALEDNNYKLKYDDLLAQTRHKLRRRYTQVPALATTSTDALQEWYMRYSSSGSSSSSMPEI